MRYNARFINTYITQNYYTIPHPRHNDRYQKFRHSKAKYSTLIKPGVNTDNLNKGNLRLEGKS